MLSFEYDYLEGCRFVKYFRILFILVRTITTFIAIKMSYEFFTSDDQKRLNQYRRRDKISETRNARMVTFKILSLAN